MNYAVQSKCLDVVKYVHDLGYGISISNITNAIIYATAEIVEYLVQYKTNLPFYLIHYLGFNCYCQEKLEKSKILINHIDLSKKLKVIDYRKETLHLQLIGKIEYQIENINRDVNYLMEHTIFFTSKRGDKLNYRLINKLKIFLELDMIDQIDITGLNGDDYQTAVDAIFFFGTRQQIEKLLPDLSRPPSIIILMELMCMHEIDKFMFVVKFPFGITCMRELVPLLNLLDDPEWKEIFDS
jgi:hypothetical protein